MQIGSVIDDLLPFKSRSKSFTSLTPPKTATSLLKQRMGLSFRLTLLEHQPPTTHGSDLSIKVLIRWPTICCVASVNGYILFPLEDFLRAEIGKVYRSAIAPSVIIPCLFIMLTNVLMFDLCICDPSVLAWFFLMSELCLFICVLWFQMMYPPLPRIPSISLSMSNFPSQSPVSTTSNSNGDGTNVQDPIPISDHDAQPPNPVVVDGIKPNCSAQPSEPSRPTFASTIKLELGSHGSDFKSTLGSKSGPKHGIPQPSGLLLKGDSSVPSSFTPLPVCDLPAV